MKWLTTVLFLIPLIPSFAAAEVDHFDAFQSEPGFTGRHAAYPFRSDLDEPQCTR